MRLLVNSRTLLCYDLFFCKQKTAYEMRMCDWSSDVCSSDLKAGSDAQPKEFNRMLRKIIEADQLREYTMTMTKTVEGAPAVLFELRGAAEAAELHARLEAERERHERYEADRRRAGEVDDLMDRDRKSTRLNSSH